MVVGIICKREGYRRHQNSALTLQTVWKSGQIGVASVVVNAMSECMGRIGSKRCSQRD
jgi:hypothetical protein